MGIKLQFNPSTGRLSHNASTGNVQIVDDGVGPVVPCSECDTPTPSTIYVTLSGLSLCCAGYTAGGQDDFKYDDGVLPLFNTTHALSKNVECLLYTKNWSVVADNVYLRPFTAGGGCVGTPAGTQILTMGVGLGIGVAGELTITVSTLTGDLGTNTAQLIYGVNQYPCFSQTLSDPEYTSCSDQHISGSILEGWTALMIGGTAVISETP